MEKRWLREGPSLSELVGKTEDARSGRKPENDIIIILPTYQRNDILEKHMLSLARQKGIGFDLVIVYGCEDDFIKGTKGIPTVHLKRKEDTGSAGGFYTGERFALDQGYNKMVLADNDCLPETESLIKDLSEKIDGGFDIVFPRIRDDGGAEPKPNDLPPQYGCMRMSMLEDIGLTYLPFYFSGEDIELRERMARKGYRMGHTDSVAYHPHDSIVSAFTCPPGKMRYYMRAYGMHGFLWSSAPKLFQNIFVHVLGGLFLLPLRSGLGWLMLESAFEASSMDFFRLRERKDPPLPEPSRRIEAIRVSHFSLDADSGTILKRAGDALSCVQRFLAQIPGMIGKDVVFDKTVRASGMLIALLARDTWVQDRGSYHKAFSGNRYYLFPLFMAYLVIIFPAAIVISAALMARGYALKSMHGISTESYGLRQPQARRKDGEGRGKRLT